MNYSKTVRGTFISRPNRFIANVNIDGVTEVVHVKNTGRCRELLMPGSAVILAESDNPLRKTKYDLVTVYKNGLGWVNIDSQLPNRVVEEWLKTDPSEFGSLTLIHPEYVYGNSRVDFYLECDNRKILLEVKGCTLEKDGVGYFPDAPTVRGVKHLHELASAVSKGYDCYIAFVIALPGVTKVLPNADTDPDFAKAYDYAKSHGVKILFLPCSVSEDGLTITDCILN